MSGPRIIVFDLETGPNLKEAIKAWPKLSSYPGQTFKAQVQTVLCFGYKVLGHREKAEVKCAWQYSGFSANPNDDLGLLKDAHHILSGADVVVTQNGKKFDWPFLQTRFLKEGLPALDPQLPHVDLKQVMSRNLRLISNSLSNAGEYLLGEGKMDHEGWPLWWKILLEKDEGCMKKMSDYCKQDVLLTEKLFKKLRPFLRGANAVVNYNLFQIKGKKDLCPTCGSPDILSNGYRATKTMTYKRIICKQCGTWSRLDAAGRNPR